MEDNVKELLAEVYTLIGESLIDGTIENEEQFAQMQKKIASAIGIPRPELELPEKISSIDEAKVFLKMLYDKGFDYHPEDSPETVYNMQTGQRLFSDNEAPKIKKLMEDIYSLPGNQVANANDMEFDPCGYLLELGGHVMEEDEE